MRGEECRTLEARAKRRQASLLEVIVKVGVKEGLEMIRISYGGRAAIGVFGRSPMAGPRSRLPAARVTCNWAAMVDISVGDDETYLLLLLADGNLPTGSFVASSGLESFVAHGFFGGSTDNLSDTVNFIRDSVATYARSALPFVADVHRVVAKAVEDGGVEDLGGRLDRVSEEIKALDELYDAMTLNHVTKRASKSQGVALLTLYTKGFSPPASLPVKPTAARDTFIGKLVDQCKLRIRREEVQGHLPVCWGVLTAALNVTLGKFPLTETQG